MTPYFTTPKAHKHYKRLSRKTRAIIRFVASLEASENRSSLDIQPHLYAIFPHHVKQGIRLRRSKHIKFHF